MNGVDITKAPGAGFVNPFVGLISFLIDNHLIFFLSIYVSLGGCYRWNFIPDDRGMKWSVSIVKSSMSLTVYTFFQRWSFIPGWTHPCQNTEGEDRNEISSQDKKKSPKHFMSGWNFTTNMFLLIFWRMYYMPFSFNRFGHK